MIESEVKKRIKMLRGQSSQQEIANELGWSLSKYRRVETTDQPLKLMDLEDIAQFHQVSSYVVWVGNEESLGVTRLKAAITAQEEHLDYLKWCLELVTSGK